MRLAVAAALAGAVLAAGAGRAERPFAAEAVTATLGAGEHVGRVRAGLLCLPKGALTWRGLGLGGLDQREIVREGLAAGGLPVAPFTGEAARRVRGTVTQAGFDLCARDWGRGRHDALSGRAAMAVAWQVEGEAGGGALAHLSQVERVISREEAAPAAAIYRTLLAAAARDLAAWLKDQR